MKNVEKVYKAIEMTDSEEIKKVLREFIVDNTQQPKGKFQMKEFVCKNELRPQLQCVCMDNKEKVAVATDTCKLFVSKEYYVDKGIDEPQTLCDIYGDVVNEECLYPNWKAVIPTDNEPIEARGDFERLVKEAEVFGKENGIKKVPEHIAVQVFDDCWLRLDLAKLMIKAGLDGWETPRDSNVRTLVKKWNGNTMLLMPFLAYIDEDDEKRGYLTFS